MTNYLAIRAARVNQIINEILASNEEQSGVCNTLRANGISFRIRSVSTDVIEFWDNLTGIKGSIPRIL